MPKALTMRFPVMVSWSSEIRSPGQREDERGDDRELPVAPENDEDEADEGEAVFQKARHRLRDGSREVGDGVGDARDQDPRGALREERQGLAQDVSVEVAAQIRDDPETDVAHEDRLAVVACPLEQVDYDDGEGDDDEHALVAVEEDVIHGRLDEEGRGGGRGAHHGHAQHGQDEPWRVRFNESKESQI